MRGKTVVVVTDLGMYCYAGRDPCRSSGTESNYVLCNLATLGLFEGLRRPLEAAGSRAVSDLEAAVPAVPQVSPDDLLTVQPT